jgi:hypothetical protein
MQIARGFAAYLISRKVGGRIVARMNSRPDTKLQDDLGSGGRGAGVEAPDQFVRLLRRE